MTRIRCLFAIPSMRGGGAERVVSLLLRHLDPSVFDLHLALAQKTGPHLATVPQHVVVHDLRAARVARCLGPLVRTTRRIRPNVLFSTISHMNLAATVLRHVLPRKTRLVLRETANCRQTLGTARWPRLRRTLYRFGYRQADTIICQTPYMFCDLQRHLQLPADKLQIIPNPVDFDMIDRLSNTPSPPLPGAGPHIVALGGLRPVKGVDRLLDAFPPLLKRHHTAQLWLLGDGPCEAALRRQADRLGIANHVHFMGFQENPYAWLRAADLLALPSRNESCSNALLEAVACRCPPVAIRHPGGTYEMLAHLGMPDRFVKQLTAWHEHWFQRPSPDAFARAKKRYSIPSVITQYSNLLRAA